MKATKCTNYGSTDIAEGNMIPNRVMSVINRNIIFCTTSPIVYDICCECGLIIQRRVTKLEKSNG